MSPIALNQQSILQGIPSHLRQTLSNLLIWDHIDSTNTYLLKQKPPLSKMACLSERQTQGRGRLGRVWHSPPGEGLYLSLLWSLPTAALSTPLTLMTSVAVTSALKQYAQKKALSDIKIKWPNDLLHQGKKLGGILIESNSAYPNWIVIGLGINCALSEQAHSAISQPCTDLVTWMGQTTKGTLPIIDRNRLASLLLTQLLDMLTALEQAPSNIPALQAHYLEQWAALDALKNQPVSLLDPHHHTPLIGTAIGITHPGQLIVRKKDNTLVFVHSGDVTLRQTEG